MTKDEFIEKCNEHRAAHNEAKLKAARRCKAGSRAYDILAANKRKAIAEAKAEAKAKAKRERKDAKS